MPFGIRQQVERIRTYATKVAAEAQSDLAKELVPLLHKSAENLELSTQFISTALGPNRTSRDPSEHRPDPSSKT